MKFIVLLWIAVVILVVAVLVGIVMRLGKLIYIDLYIMQHGTKMTGTCSRYHFQRWRYGHDVEWHNESGNLRRRRFNVFLPRLKYPCEVTVYSLDGVESLGLCEVLKNALLLAVSVAILVIIVWGTIEMFII